MAVAICTGSSFDISLKPKTKNLEGIRMSREKYDKKKICYKHQNYIQHGRDIFCHVHYNEKRSRVILITIINRMRT